MQTIQPEILVHRNSAFRVESIPTWRPVRIGRTIIRHVPIPRRLLIGGRIVEDGIEEAIGVEEEHCGVSVRAPEGLRELTDVGVEVLDVGRLKARGGGALAYCEGRAVDGRDVHEEEVASAGLVEL